MAPKSRSEITDQELLRAPVDASERDGALQIPLKQLGAGDLDLLVGLLYEEPPLALPSTTTKLRLAAPALLDLDPAAARVAGRLAVASTLWRVELPGGYSATLAGGNMDEVVSSIEFASKVDSNICEVKRLTGLLKTDEGAAVGPSGRLSRRQRQQVESLERLEEAKRYQKLLAGAIAESEAGGERAPSAGEQAFQDHYHFLGNRWVLYAPIDGAAPPQGPPEAGAKLDLGRLLEGESAGALAAPERLTRPRARPRSTPRPRAPSARAAWRRYRRPRQPAPAPPSKLRRRRGARGA